MGSETVKFRITILIAGLFLSLLFCLSPLFASDYDFSQEGDFGTYEEPAFVTESGDVFSSMQEGFEEIESSSVDIVLPNANIPAIQELNKGMKGLSSEERLNYVREHGGEYNNNGAVTVFAGENVGEVVVNNGIHSDALVEYLPLGKAELGHQTSLQGALLELTKYPENANIKEATLPVLTYKLIDDQMMSTAQMITPGVLATCIHGPGAQPNQTINLGYVSIGEKDDSRHIDKQVVVDRVMQGEVGKYSDTDARLITIKNPDVLETYIANPIPVMPLENNSAQRGEKTKTFLRKNNDIFGVQYPEHFSEAEVVFTGVRNESAPQNWTKHPVMSGHSGTFEYNLDSNGNVRLLGPVVKALTFGGGPAPFGIYVNPKVVTELRDKLADEYERNATGGGLTQSEKNYLLKKTSDELSHEYQGQSRREHDLPVLTTFPRVRLPGEPE